MPTKNYTVDARPGSFRSNLDFEKVKAIVTENLNEMVTNVRNLHIAQEMVKIAEADGRRAKDRSPLSEEEIAEMRDSERSLMSDLGMIDPHRIAFRLTERVSAIKREQSRDLTKAKIGSSVAKILAGSATILADNTGLIATATNSANIGGEFVSIMDALRDENLSIAERTAILKSSADMYREVSDNSVKSFTENLQNFMEDVAYGVLRHQGQNARTYLVQHGKTPKEGNALAEHDDEFGRAGEAAINRLHDHAAAASGWVKALLSKSFNNARKALPKERAHAPGIDIVTKSHWLSNLASPSYPIARDVSKECVESPDRLREEVLGLVSVGRLASLDIEIPHRMVRLISDRYRSGEDSVFDPTVLFNHSHFIQLARSYGTEDVTNRWTPVIKDVRASTKWIDEELQLCDLVLEREGLGAPKRADQIDSARRDIGKLRDELDRIVGINYVHLRMGMTAGIGHYANLRKEILGDVKTQETERQMTILMDRLPRQNPTDLEALPNEPPHRPKVS